MSRSPHGERGLKCSSRIKGEIEMSRSPHGERGLKCGIGESSSRSRDVAPRTGSVD